MRAVLILFTSLAAALATNNSGRIFGGSLTEIEQYPQAAVILTTSDLTVFYQTCGGTIINSLAILTAAHCPGRWGESERFRVRVGSSFASSGGAVHLIQRIILHPNFNANTRDNDVAVLRLASALTFTDVVQRGGIAGPNYNVADNRRVTAIGWGLTQFGDYSEQLQHVEVNTFNQDRCRQLHSNTLISDNMLCAHTEQLGQGGCMGDDGGPLLHNNVVIGVQSFTYACSLTARPAVYTRVNQFTEWIVANAQS